MTPRPQHRCPSHRDAPRSARRLILVIVTVTLSTSPAATFDRTGTASAARRPDVSCSDPLEKLARLGYRVDVSAYRGLPRDRLGADLERLVRAAEAIVARHPDSRVLRIPQWKLLNNPGDRPPKSASKELERYREIVKSGRVYPMKDAVVESLPTTPLPIRLIPDPTFVRRYLKSNGVGPQRRPPSQALIDVGFAGVPYAIALHFEPGPDSNDPGVPCAMPERSGNLGPRPHLRKNYVSALRLGKVIVQVEDLARVRKALAWGTAGGAKPRSEIYVAEPIDGIWIARDLSRKKNATVDGTPSKSDVSFTLAFPIADANGAARSDRSLTGPVSPFANNLEAKLTSSTPNQLTALRLPRPRPPGTSDKSVRKLRHGEERRRRTRQEWFVVTDDLLAVHPVVVLRADKSWRPFAEDWILDTKTKLDGSTPARALVMTASVSGHDLLQWMAHLRGIERTPIADDEKIVDSIR